MIDREKLPYRNCAGIVLFNRDGKVFLGRRITPSSKMQAEVSAPWQMPQGGIDEGEDPKKGALRELYEETNVRSARVIGQVDDWLRYDLPDAALGIGLKGKYRGQQQRWFAALFDGDDAEIDVLAPMDGTAKAEFDAWQWVELARISDLVVAFKRDVYAEVARQFADLPKRIRNGEFR